MELLGERTEQLRAHTVLHIPLPANHMDKGGSRQGVGDSRRVGTQGHEGQGLSPESSPRRGIYTRRIVGKFSRLFLPRAGLP